MSERKVINKYYPPDFDPDKVPRNKKKPNDLKQVRMMAPFNMKCTTCGEYIGFQKKFNAKKETVEDKRYEGIMVVYRFLINCPRCMGKIVFRTNPDGYEVESGATENFMAFKMAEKQAVEEAEAEKEEEKINPMKHLESRTNASKRQMEASEQIQNLRLLKRDYHKIDVDKIIHDKQLEAIEETRQKSNEDDEDDIREEAIRLLSKRAISKPDVITDSSNDTVGSKSSPSATKSFKRPISASLNDLKKKIKINKPQQK